MQSLVNLKKRISRINLYFFLFFLFIFGLFTIGFYYSFNDGAILDKILHNPKFSLLSSIYVIVLYLIYKWHQKQIFDILKEFENRFEEEKRNFEEKLKESFYKDKLTKLPNREKLIEDMRKYKYVALFNINSFKEINAFYGIKIGDKVLFEVANVLRNIDNPYKLPADEFAFLSNDSQELIKKVKEAIEEVEKIKIKVNEDEIEISVMAGIGKSLIEADMALKYLKCNKVDKYIVYSDNLPIVKEYENNIKWKNIIKKAINDDKVIPFIQPIVKSDTCDIEEYECLIRIEYEGKIYSPYFFLDVAKKTGQYIELQKIMIDKCFSKFAKLDVKFSINLSAFELSDMEFRKFLIDKIDEYDIGEKLIIELLEDENLHNEEMMGFLIFLWSLGVGFAIDDFGSGYSNLSYLITKLPVTILKIDGSLIKNLKNNENNYKLVKALVHMAKIFNLKVIAEFVEDKEIADILREFRVDYFQGYHIGKPIELDSI